MHGPDLQCNNQQSVTGLIANPLHACRAISQIGKLYCPAARCHSSRRSVGGCTPRQLLLFAPLLITLMTDSYPSFSPALTACLLSRKC